MNVARDVKEVKPKHPSAASCVSTIGLVCLGLALVSMVMTAPFSLARAQSQQPEAPIETTIAAFLTLSAAKPTLTRTPTATRTTNPTRTRTPTATKPVPPTATKISLTATASPTFTPTPTLTPQHTPTPTETPEVTPQASSTMRPSPIVRGYLPIVMRDYPCGTTLPDCFEDNNGFAKAYGPLAIGEIYLATEDIDLDRYDYYTVTLTSGTRYTFTASFPRHDLDLYVQGNGPAYAVLAKSATAQDGGTEQTTFTPSITVDYYILVYTFEATGIVNYQLQITNP